MQFSNREAVIVAYYNFEILLVAQKLQKSFVIDIPKRMAGPGFGSSGRNQGISVLLCWLFWIEFAYADVRILSFGGGLGFFFK